MRERFNIDRFDHVPDKLYNIDPEEEIAVIIRAENGTRVMKSMRWGFNPFWAEDTYEEVGTAIIWHGPAMAKRTV